MLLDCARRCAPFLLLVTLGACSVNATVTTTDSCTSDPTLICPGTGDGYSCTGGLVQSIAGQVCTTDGAGDFCCYPTPCSPDPAVDCGSSATGYSCGAGAAPPDAVDSSLVCSVPTAAGSADVYCCYQNTMAPPAGATCEPDSSVQGCEPDGNGVPSYGFSCTGADPPTADYSSLAQCSVPTDGQDADGNAASLYCCTYQ
jgi:hypothetical protein